MTTVGQSSRATLDDTGKASRTLLVGQGLLVGSYLALVLVPFIANGLPAEPAEQVAGGAFDPKGLWPQDTAPFGQLLGVAATSASVFTWLLTAGLALTGLVLVATRWRRMARADRLRIAAVIVLAAAFQAVQFSAPGQLISHWMAD